MKTIHPPWLYDYLVIGTVVRETNLTKFTNSSPIFVDKIITPLRSEKTSVLNKRLFSDMLATVTIVNSAIFKAIGGENDA